MWHEANQGPRNPVRPWTLPLPTVGSDDPHAQLEQLRAARQQPAANASALERLKLTWAENVVRCLAHDVGSLAASTGGVWAKLLHTTDATALVLTADVYLEMTGYITELLSVHKADSTEWVQAAAEAYYNSTTAMMLFKALYLRLGGELKALPDDADVPTLLLHMKDLQGRALAHAIWDLCFSRLLTHPLVCLPGWR